MDGCQLGLLGASRERFGEREGGRRERKIDNSIIGAPFVDIRAKLDSLKNMMPAQSLGAEQCNLIG